MASIVAVAGPPAETPDVCRERTRGAAGTQELHTGKYLGSEYKEQGDRQENSGRRRPASCGAAPHTGKECGQSNCVRRQVGDPGELLLALQILDTLSEPGGHGAPPDGNLDDTDASMSAAETSAPTAQPSPGPAPANLGNTTTAAVPAMTATTPHAVPICVSRSCGAMRAAMAGCAVAPYAATCLDRPSSWLMLAA